MQRAASVSLRSHGKTGDSRKDCAEDPRVLAIGAQPRILGRQIGGQLAKRTHLDQRDTHRELNQDMPERSPRLVRPAESNQVRKQVRTDRAHSSCASPEYIWTRDAALSVGRGKPSGSWADEDLSRCADGIRSLVRKIAGSRSEPHH